MRIISFNARGTHGKLAAELDLILEKHHGQLLAEDAEDAEVDQAFEPGPWPEEGD